MFYLSISEDIHNGKMMLISEGCKNMKLITRKTSPQRAVNTAITTFYCLLRLFVWSKLVDLNGWTWSARSSLWSGSLKISKPFKIAETCWCLLNSITQVTEWNQWMEFLFSSTFDYDVAWNAYGIVAPFHFVFEII